MPIANRLSPVDNPLVVIDSQRASIDSGALVISSQSTPVDNGDDSIAKAFNPVHGADNPIVERRKRVATLCAPTSKKDGSVAEKFASFPPPAGTVCKPKLLIEKVRLSIAAQYKPVAMRLSAFPNSRGTGAGATDLVASQVLEGSEHWVVLLKTSGTATKFWTFVK